MSEHKLDAGQLVMVRSALGEIWRLQHFSHYDANNRYGSNFVTIGGGGHLFCIPHSEDTKHLLGMPDPYEPPKPPHEYKWGDRVEVNICGDWGIALYIAPTTDPGEHWCSTKKRPYSMAAFKIRDLRPLEPSHD